MDEVLSQSAIYNLYMIFVFASALAFFWILESVWANDRRWLPAIIVFPPAILLFIYNYWEETRFRCFIAAILFLIILIVGGLVGHSIVADIGYLLYKVMFWPYYVTKWLLVKFALR